MTEAVEPATDPAAPGREAEEAAGIGSLAIVLHSHMPYVEGFGTYPFGEEWLFDAVIRSYVPVCEHAQRLTMTVTPVLADQLEADGVAERLLEFLRRFRIESCDADATDVEAALSPGMPRARPIATAARWRCSRHSTATCRRCFGRPASRDGSS